MCKTFNESSRKVVFLLRQSHNKRCRSKERVPGDKAFEAVQNNFRNQIDKEKTISTYTEPRKGATEINQDNKEAQDMEVATNIAQLYYGTDAQVQEAEDFLRSIKT